MKWRSNCSSSATKLKNATARQENSPASFPLLCFPSQQVIHGSPEEESELSKSPYSLGNLSDPPTQIKHRRDEKSAPGFLSSQQHKVPQARALSTEIWQRPSLLLIRKNKIPLRCQHHTHAAVTPDFDGLRHTTNSYFVRMCIMGGTGKGKDSMNAQTPALEMEGMQLAFATWQPLHTVVLLTTLT